jgi:hypothetical protein
MDTTQRTTAPTTEELRERYRDHTGSEPPRAWVRADLVNYFAAAIRALEV